MPHAHLALSKRKDLKTAAFTLRCLQNSAQRHSLKKKAARAGDKASEDPEKHPLRAGIGSAASNLG